MKPDPQLLDLADFLAYHGTVIYAEARDLPLPGERGDYPSPEPSGRTDGLDVEFTLTHEGRKYLVSVSLLEAR